MANRCSPTPDEPSAAPRCLRDCRQRFQRLGCGRVAPHFPAWTAQANAPARRRARRPHIRAPGQTDHGTDPPRRGVRRHRPRGAAANPQPQAPREAFCSVRIGSLTIATAHTQARCVVPALRKRFGVCAPACACSYIKVVRNRSRAWQRSGTRTPSSPPRLSRPSPSRSLSHATGGTGAQLYREGTRSRELPGGHPENPPAARPSPAAPRSARARSSMRRSPPAAASRTRRARHAPAPARVMRSLAGRLPAARRR